MVFWRHAAMKIQFPAADAEIGRCPRGAEAASPSLLEARTLKSTRESGFWVEVLGAKDGE